MVTRGLAQFLAVLRAQVHLFDFDRNGFGESLMDTASGSTLKTMNAETDPDGNRWPELSDRYDAWKSLRYPGQEMGLLHGVLKAPENLAGIRTIAATKARQVYANSAEAFEEAVHFSQDRPFWGLGADGVAAQKRTVLAHGRKHIKDK